MKIQIAPLLLAVAIFVSSCASILNSRYQKVSIQTGDPKARVFVNKDSIGTGAELKVKMDRLLGFHQVTIKREGYADEHHVIGQTYKSALHIISWIPFGVLFLYPPMLDKFPRAFNYNKKYDFRNKVLVKAPKRQSNQKYLYLESTSFDVSKIGGQRQTYAQYLNNEKGVPYNPITKTNRGNANIDAPKDLEIENSIFTEKLNQILAKTGFVDTTNTLLKSFVNTLYIKGTVRQFDVNQISSVIKLKIDDESFYTNLKVEWEIQDFYNQPLTKKIITTTSGTYNRSYDFKEIVADGLLLSFYEFLDDKSVQQLILMNENAKDTKAKELVLTKPAKPIENLQDAIKATATIVVDKGHGSGFFVSPDGYMITNYHVVAGSKKITVKTNDDKSYEARIIEKNEFSDLALIKIDQKVEYAFTLPEKAVFSVGESCFAIGTPKSVELGQTLTKGIISATRDKAGQKIIQTDVSINSGNSGGALVSPQGSLIGVVSAKLMGVGIEGIAFGVLADDILKYLNIRY